MKLFIKTCHAGLGTKKVFLHDVLRKVASIACFLLAIFQIDSLTSCKARKNKGSNLEETTKINGEDIDLTRFTSGPNQLSTEEIEAYGKFSSLKKSDNGVLWYKRINAALREENSAEIKKFAAEIRNIASFVNKNRDGICTFRRFLDVSDKMEAVVSKKGNAFVEVGFFSATENQMAPSGFENKKHVIVGVTSNCARVSKWLDAPELREVLFPPGSEFVVTKDRVGNTFFIQEVDPAIPTNSRIAPIETFGLGNEDWDDRMRKTPKNEASLLAELKELEEKKKKELEQEVARLAQQKIEQEKRLAEAKAKVDREMEAIRRKAHLEALARVREENARREVAEQLARSQRERIEQETRRLEQEQLRAERQRSLDRIDSNLEKLRKMQGSSSHGSSSTNMSHKQHIDRLDSLFERLDALENN